VTFASKIQTWEFVKRQHRGASGATTPALAACAPPLLYQSPPSPIQRFQGTWEEVPVTSLSSIHTSMDRPRSTSRSQYTAPGHVPCQFVPVLLFPVENVPYGLWLMASGAQRLWGCPPPAARPTVTVNVSRLFVIKF